MCMAFISSPCRRLRPHPHHSTILPSSVMGGGEVDNGGAEAHLQFARKMQRYAQPNIIEQTNKQANGKTHMDKFICFVHTQ